MKQAATRMLFSYWDGLRGERAAPERGEIEPGEIRGVLPDAFVLELGRDRRADVRLGGTRLCALLGGELRGRSFESLWSDDAILDVRRSLRIVVEDAAGVVAGVVGTTPDGARLDLEMLLLPLRHRGRPHTRILGAMAPTHVPAWLGFEALSALSLVSLRVLWPTTPAEPAEAAVEVTSRPGSRRFVVHQGGRL